MSESEAGRRLATYMMLGASLRTPPPGPPGAPSHTHDDGTECRFDMSIGRWYWIECPDDRVSLIAHPCPDDEPCDMCNGTGWSKQGWTDKRGYSEDQFGPCLCGRGQANER